MKLDIYLGYGQGRAPLFLQNVKANAAIAVNVRVKHLCPECNLHKTKQVEQTSDKQH